jgi:predicted phage tail component-like protein
VLILDNKPLSDFGIEVVEFGSTPMYPQTRDRTLEVPGRHGSYYFGSDLGAREFSHACGFIHTDDKADLQAKVNAFMTFLTDEWGRPRKDIRLTYAHEPDKYYKVRIVGGHDLAHVWQLGYFTLKFIADDPLKQSVVTSDQIVMDSDTPIMSDLLWDTGLSERTITAPTSFTIANNGSTAIRFSFAVEGSGTNVTVAANGKTFTLGTFANKTIEVDGDSYIVKVDGVEDLTLADGDFIELMPGINEVTVGGSALNLTISESLTYKYV